MRRITLRQIVIALALIAGACGSTTIDETATSEPTSDTADTADADGAGSGSTTSTSTAPVEAAAGGMVVDESGPVSDAVVYFDDPGYFDVLGVDAVRITRTFTRSSNEVESEVFELDRFGNLHSDDLWLRDGQLLRVEDDGYVDAFYGGRLTDPVTLGVKVSDIKPSVRELVVPIGEIADDGALRHEHAAVSEALLDHERASTPEFWEWNSAGLDIITTPKGALLRYELVRDYRWVPAPNMVDPPPPVDTIERTVYEVEPIAEITPFPDVEPVSDRADRLTLGLLDLAGRSFDSAISFEPAVGADQFNDILERNRSPLLRYGITVSDDLEATSPTVMGLLGGVFLLQSESGTWFCHAARADNRELRYAVQDDGQLEQIPALTASGTDPDRIIADCQTQRDDLRESQGLPAWNR